MIRPFSIVSVDKLTKVYGGRAAIDAVSFTITKGEVVGFVGLNGAGKSTTINSLLGFLRPSSGVIELFGKRVLPENAHNSHKKLGFASGDMSLFTNLTGKQYFDFVAHRYHLKNMSKCNDLVTRFEPDLDKKIGTLSRGNKQKIALIAAFMASPELVILDEPSSGLDPLMQQLFIELIRSEREAGTTIFMSSHYLNEVIDVCSRILLIRDGKLIKDIPSAELMNDGGKLVHITTHHEILPPKDAKDIEKNQIEGGFELTFTYKATAAKLQQWLGGVTQLIDLTISDHTIEAAFDDLYELETGEVNHA
jgi:ABC-2 type transport system ATP-binding protein